MVYHFLTTQRNLNYTLNYTLSELHTEQCLETFVTYFWQIQTATTEEHPFNAPHVQPCPPTFIKIHKLRSLRVPSSTIIPRSFIIVPWLLHDLCVAPRLPPTGLANSGTCHITPKGTVRAIIVDTCSEVDNSW